MRECGWSNVFVLGGCQEQGGYIVNQGGEKLATDPEFMKRLIDHVAESGEKPSDVVSGFVGYFDSMIQKLRNAWSGTQEGMSRDEEAALAALQDMRNAWSAMYQYAAAVEKERGGGNPAEVSAADADRAAYSLPGGNTPGDGTETGDEEKKGVSALEILSRPANELAPEDFGVIDYAKALEEISASIGGDRDAAREIVNEEIEKAKAEASEIERKMAEVKGFAGIPLRKALATVQAKIAALHGIAGEGSAGAVKTGESLGETRGAVEGLGTERRGTDETSGKEDRFSLRAKRDKEYEEAVKLGDIDTARRMLEEEAERKGYFLESDYQGTSAFNGAAPSRSDYYGSEKEMQAALDNGTWEGDVSAKIMFDNMDSFPLADLISDRELAYHRRSYSPYSRSKVESIMALRAAYAEYIRGNKDVTIKSYRSVPAGVKEGTVRNGDWVTLSPTYARENAEIHAGYGSKHGVGWSKNGTSKIIEMEVPLADLWWDQNDVNEWGYDDGRTYAYKNTKNNRKVFEPTYDENGNLIPLSKRFDRSNSDDRYSLMKEDVARLGKPTPPERHEGEDRRAYGKRLAEWNKENQDFTAMNPLTEEQKTALAETEVQNVVVKGNDLPTDRQSAFAELQRIDPNKEGFVNRQSGESWHVSRNDLKHSEKYNHDNKDAVYAMTKGLPDVIGNAIKVANEPVKKERWRNVTNVEVYYCPVNIQAIVR